jgi:hypothetical protein
MTDKIGSDFATWCRSFGFTVDQLALNRTGAVDPTQMHGAWSTVLRDLTLAVLLVAIGLVAALFARAWWRWVFLVGTIALSVFYAFVGIQMLRDIRHPEAVSLDGKPTFEGGHRESTNMRIGGKVFSYSSRLPDERRPINLMSTDQVYRVYYLRHTGGLLSMEPVAASPPRK